VEELDALTVVPFTEDHVPNPYPGGDPPWQTYHTVRNAIVQTCRKYGPTGPMGVVKILEGVKDLYRQLAADRLAFWEQGSSDRCRGSHPVNLGRAGQLESVP